MKENAFRANVVKWIEEQSPLNFVWVNEARSKRGFPDLTICLQNRVVFAELKICHDDYIDRKKLLKLFAPIQLRTIDQIVKSGNPVWGLVYYPRFKDVVQIDFRLRTYGNAPAIIFRRNFRTAIAGNI